MRSKPFIAVTFCLGLFLVVVNIWNVNSIEASSKNCADGALTLPSSINNNNNASRPLVFAAFGRKVSQRKYLLFFYYVWNKVETFLIVFIPRTVSWKQDI